MTGHGPIQQEYEVRMHALAEMLDEFLNDDLRGNDRKVGFAVLLFPFGEDPKGRINYISNANRKDMFAALKELIARWEGMFQEGGRA